MTLLPCLTPWRWRRRGATLATLVALLVALPAILVACFGSNSIEEHFYSLTTPRLALEKGRGPRLLVADLAGAPGYDTARLAYRVSAHELRYYAYRQWVTEPPKMLSEAVMRHLRASGRFSDVGRGDKMREPDAVLEGSVDAIEEVDIDEPSWKARLAMSFQLRRAESETVLLRHAFDVTIPCARRNPEEVAKTISSILNREMERLARLIANAMPAPTPK